MEKNTLRNFSRAEKEVRTEVAELLQEVVGEKFFAESIGLTSPPSSDLGEFSLPCFSFAKVLGKNPQEAARSIAENFFRSGRKKILSRAQSAGPYVNFFVDEKKFYGMLLGEILKRGGLYGSSEMGKGKKIMVEYSQPNTHKEFHIGHLRNICIGGALVNLYSAMGYRVISANYIGDIGAHVAKCLWAYLRFHKGVTPPHNKGKYLGKIYVEAFLKLEEHPEWQKEVSEILQNLEAGEKKLLSLWKKTRKWSLDEFSRIYQRLGVHFDEYFFESEVEKDGKKLVQELLRSHIAQRSEGAVIVDLEKYGLKKFLILKSDGTSLYATKDLALAQKKFKKYKIDKSFYVVDSRQSLYFKQLFKTLELMNFRKEMAHIPYEFVTLKDGAMSSRSGNAVLFEDLEEKIFERAREETKKRHPDWSAKEIGRISRRLAFSAMKYGMLSYGNNSPIVFDMVRSLELAGNTGPYLQYTHTRIASILKKAKAKGELTASIPETEKEERELLLELSRFPKIIEDAAMRFDPSHLSNYLFGLSQAFSLFYETVPVLKSESEKREFRLALVRAVKQVMSAGLNLLGIPPLEKM